MTDGTGSDTGTAAPAQMFQLLSGFVTAQALYVVAELGIPDELLAGPRTVAELAALLARHPDRAGIVFDLPAVVAAAGEAIRAAGLDDRVRAVAGDFFDGVPEADVYLLSTVLHDWSDALATDIVRGVAKAARPGARLVLVETVLPDGEAPGSAGLLDLIMLGLLGGKERTWPSGPGCWLTAASRWTGS